MLVQLSIQNVVLIEELVLELGAGFNVITGETGAGKSILIHALSLVLGGRVRPEVLRGGADEAQVEALFEIAPASRAAARLEASGISADRELVVRRVVQSTGGEGRSEIRSRAYINGRLCTASQLTEIARDLCDIASQHESVSLTDPATHADYLDAFAALQGHRERLGEQVDALAAVVGELGAQTALERDRAEREDFLRWQLHEIDELGPRDGEENELAQELARLSHAERLQATSKRAVEGLYEGEGAVCDVLAKIATDLEQAAVIDSSLSPYLRTLQLARSEVTDVARALSRYGESVDSSPERLAEVRERAFRLQQLLRKHGPTTRDLLAYRARLAAELESLSSGADRIAALLTEKVRRFELAEATARDLSRLRHGAAHALGAAIGNELAQLGMGRARVLVEVTAASASGDALVVDGARLSRGGIDRVEFLIAPNRGEEPRPLRRIASGGELSRALLALKRVLADKGPVGTYVFDEVDAGVSGAVAEVIGHAVADIARHRQVICITHLPQIAALGETHFAVDKSETRGRTRATVRRLSPKERVEEIARMIGGIKIGDAARRAAAELLARP